MPLMTIRSAVSLDDAAVRAMLAACSARLGELLGQPEAYVMTLFDRSTGMTMAGTADPCGLVEVRSVVPFTSEQTQAVARAFCPLLQAHLGVPPQPHLPELHRFFEDDVGVRRPHPGAAAGIRY